MSADTVTPAILSYVSYGHFPSLDDQNHSESILSAPLDAPSTLSSLLASLRSAQKAAQDDLRQLSRATAPDVDTWITRAHSLHADLLRSRADARAIVAEAEAAAASRDAARDQGRKVALLEAEVRFNESLTAALRNVGQVDAVLAAVQEGMVRGGLERAMEGLERADADIQGLLQGRIKGLLAERRRGLVDGLKEMVVAAWQRGVEVDLEGRRVGIVRDMLGDVDRADLEEIVRAAQGLGLFSSLVERLGRGIIQAIIAPRLAVGRDDAVPRIVIQDDKLLCEGKSDDSSYKLLFEDLHTVVEFLSSRLPSTVSIPLSETLVPALTAKVEEEWLNPAIPLAVNDMPSFQAIFEDVLKFAGQLDALGWYGGQALREWVQNMPRTWITKKREQILGDVRNLVFTGLRETKVVERVETQIVSNGSTLVTGDEGGDEWDTAWDEPEEPETKADPPTAAQDNDDEDASAWDIDDSEEKPDEEAGEEDAWGWGDGDDTAPQPAVPNKTDMKAAPEQSRQKSSQAPAEREMTLREEYSVTAVPDNLIALVKQVISDAETLADPEYSSLPIAPAATALYTLPTLALAIYRATAPTAYAKLNTGNMLIYNDASRLSDQLRSWQASQPPSSRLRLDNDVKALDQFAKRAYSGEMESQRTILRDLLDGAQGFNNCTSAPFKAECENAVEQTVYRLRDVHKQWTGVLPPSALLQSIGSLLASVTGKFITDIEDLPDISEADSKELKSLCDSASSVKELFVQQTRDGATNDMTFIYCPNWLKFQYLGELMESSLADIKYLWNEGELSLEFEAEEVVGLIEALFAESQLRKQAIADIRRRSRH